MAAATAMDMDTMEQQDVAEITALEGITLVAKWGKERVTLENVSPATTIGQVKVMLSQHTNILPKRQKLIGLVVANGGGKVTDDILVKDLKSKGKKQNGEGATFQFILMGTQEHHIFVDPHEKDDLPDVIDDFDLDFNAGSEQWLNHVAAGESLKKFTETTVIHIMNEPRQGKPLMVLDLDHTLLDFSSKSILRDTSIHGESAAKMKRPYMDEFLTAAYRCYDLVVWSQTSWRWLETKLIELGMLTHSGYKFCFVLDKTSMFAITSTKRDGSTFQHHVKPLQIIWTKFPRWGPQNTVHLDDLARNFALNLGSGLKVTAYYRKNSKGKRDAELSGLARYLEMVALAGVSFEHVDFDKWEDVLSDKCPLVQENSKKASSS